MGPCSYEREHSQIDPFTGQAHGGERTGICPNPMAHLVLCSPSQESLSAQREFILRLRYAIRERLGEPAALANLRGL